MGEKVAEERRVLVEECCELERVLGGDQLVEADRPRRQRGPVAGPELVVGVRSPVTHTLEDHGAIIGRALGVASRVTGMADGPTPAQDQAQDPISAAVSAGYAF